LLIQWVLPTGVQIPLIAPFLVLIDDRLMMRVRKFGSCGTCPDFGATAKV